LPINNIKKYFKNSFNKIIKYIDLFFLLYYNYNREKGIIIIKGAFMIFGEYLKLLRSEKEISLRTLAKMLEMDAGNLSKLERGIIKPPQNEDIINKISNVLNLNKDQKKRLIDLASSSNGDYPMDIKESLSENTAIPILLRTISNKRLTDAEIMELTKKINEEY